MEGPLEAGSGSQVGISAFQPGATLAIPAIRPDRARGAESYLSVIMTRILPACFFLVCLTSPAQKLVFLVSQPEFSREGFPRVTFYVSVGHQVAALFSLALIVTLYMIRPLPVAKARGTRPMVTALMPLFLVGLLSLAPKAEGAVIQTTIATVTLFCGTGFAFTALVALGRSFSILPQARRLVTTGPYSLIRHPIYLGEMVAAAGFALQSLSPWTVLIFAAFIRAMTRRMNYEEAVLTQAFPEYADYKARTFRLIPNVY